MRSARVETLNAVLQLARHIESAHGSMLHNPGDMITELIRQLELRLRDTEPIDACERCARKRGGA